MLFIYLDDQPVGALIEYIEKRDGRTRATFAEVVQIEKNVLLFDKTKHHALLALLCAEALRRGRPYLLLPVVAESSLLVGTPPKDIQEILVKYGVPFCPSLPNPQT